MFFYFHISPSVGPARCSAQPGSCRFGGPRDHFFTIEAAQSRFEQMNKDKTFQVLQKKPKKQKNKQFGKFVKVAGMGVAAVISVQGLLQALPVDNVGANPPVSTRVDSESVSRSSENIEKPAENIEQSSENGGNSKKDEDFKNIDETAENVLFRGEELTPSVHEVEQAKDVLATLPIVDVYDGRFGEYDRKTFGNYNKVKGEIEERDILNATFNEKGRAISGSFRDPYTGEMLQVGVDELNLDHIVSLSEIHYSQTRELPPEEKNAAATDSRNLQYVEASVNKSKSDKDLGEWVPSFEPSQCKIAIANIEVKASYDLSIDSREHRAIQQILEEKCPS